jgi:hypothetical protein
MKYADSLTFYLQPKPYSMRLFYLFIPLFLSCKTNALLQKTEIAQYDTKLKKYSYLLVGLPPKDTIHTVKPNGATGFFIRDANNRLFLVSAYHVLTGCDVLIGKFYPKQDDSLQVWYTDTSGNYTFEQFPLTAYKNKPCDSLTPDVDTMDVTGHFKDGRILSIEQLMPHSLPQYQIAKEDTIICYGYHRKKSPSKTENKPVNPSHKISCVTGYNGKFKDRQDSLIYFDIRPVLRTGFSGTPIFRIKAKGDPEFVGIQSSTARGNILSVVVKSFELGKLIQWK